MLSLATLLSALLILAGIQMAGANIRKILVKQEPSAKRSDFDLNAALRRIQFLDPNARILHAVIGETPKVEWIDNPATLRQMIQTKVPPPILTVMQLNVDEATEYFRSQLKVRLQHALASYLFVRLPIGVDKAAQQQMEAMNVGQASAADMAARAKELYDKGNLRGPQKFDAKDFAENIAIAAFGLILITLLGGTWRTLTGA